MSGLVVGVGARRGAPVDEVLGLILRVLREAGAAREAVVALATVDAKADEPGIVAAAAALGVPLLTYPAGELAKVRVPHPSQTPAAALGTASVAEAAALMGGGELVAAKRKSGGQGGPGAVTCAIVRRADSSIPELDMIPDVTNSGPVGQHRQHRPHGKENV